MGGAQEYLASLAAEQAQLGLAPFILTADRGPFVQRYRDAARVEIIPALAAGVAPLQNIQALAALARVLSRHRVDVIHGHTSRGLVYAALTRRLLRRPAVASAHGFNSAHAQMRPAAARLATWVKRTAVASLDGITVAADAIRGAVVRLGIPKEKIDVVYAGIDTSRFYPRRTQVAPVLRVGAAGRFIPIKGLRFYVEAACLLLDQGAPAEFRLYGDGPEGAALRSLVKARGHAGRIEFLPFQPDFEKILREWDIAVVPSVVDSFPFLVLEAMATGIPVVASRVGGIPEALHDGVEGLLVPASRADLLASAVNRLLADASMRERMGAAGLAACRQRFTWRQAALDYLRIYDRILGSAPVRG